MIDGYIPSWVTKKSKPFDEKFGLSMRFYSNLSMRDRSRRNTRKFDADAPKLKFRAQGFIDGDDKIAPFRLPAGRKFGYLSVNQWRLGCPSRKCQKIFFCNSFIFIARVAETSDWSAPKEQPANLAMLKASSSSNSRGLEWLL
ncbi:hypothetical protein [Paramagnetospirillum caucaseum]|uniref:hypothetical protein n=1 Tax=Paramagnetospirillum caucaseum TaxID=1244869 RepID=UPI0012679A8D|nr:hypothetical protein [Paramagnetospirillum caucaseum]